MFKYLCRLLMTLFLLVGGTVYGAPAPANSTIGTQATLSYTDTNGQTVTVTSNTIVVTVNTVKDVSVTPVTANYSARAGQNVSFPVTITNTGNIADIYRVYTANDSDLPNLVFTIDTNGNGVLDAGEVTTIQPYGVTPSVAAGGSLKLIVTGTIPTTAVNGTILSSIVHGKSTTLDTVVAWSENRFTIADVANVVVTKTAVNTGVANQLAFDLKLTNSAAVASGLVTITDTLPTNATIVGTTASWTPAGQTVAKNITYADDGVEPNSNEVNLKVVNGVLTFTHTAMPANSTIGGVLRVVMSYTGLTGGTKIENRASYTYNNGTATVGPFSTATAVYAVPETTAAVEISTEVSLTAFAGDYITVPQIVLNRGNVAASYNLTVENTTYVTNPVFYVDDNGDGIHQSNETTVITNTGTLNPGQSIRIIMKGLLAGGTPVGTNTFRIYARATTGTVSDWSDITLNVLQAGTVVTIQPNVTVSGTAGQAITVPQTISNLGNTADFYVLSIGDPSQLLDVKYYVDTNGDGVRQAGETTQITAPVAVAAGGTAKIFMVGTIPTGAPATFVVRLYATSQGNGNILDWSDITVNTTAPAAVAVTKAIINNTFPGVFDYSLKITNTSATAGTALVITDTLPTNVTAQGTDAKWYPFGDGTNFKWASFADNGPEITSNDISFKLISGVATLSYLGNVPANTTSTSLGGELIISVKVNSGVAYGTVIANTANFTYNNGITAGVTGTSNTVNYTVPTPFNAVDIAADLTLNVASGEQVVIPQTITNKTAAAATYTLSMDSTTSLTGVKYYVDTNGDGIRQYTETTELVNGVTPSIAANGNLKIFVVGTASSTTATQYSFKVYAVSNVSTSDYDFSTITLNIGLASVLVDVSPEATLTTFQGATITIAQTITNKTATADTYALSLSGTAVFSSYQFILDTNGDGIRQAGETTVVTTTSSVAANNGTYKFFLVGTLRTDLQATETFRIMVKSTTNNLAVDWSGVTLNVSSTPPAAVAVTKAIINNTFPGVFDYSLKITNTSATAGTALVITDTLPTNVTAQGTDAKWYPFGDGTNFKWASFADNGPEITSNDISFKLISGVATLSYLGNVPANTTSTSLGGELIISVKVNSGVAYGTVIANTANFTYNNGITAGVTGTSNTVNYTVPTPFNAVDLAADLTINAAVAETVTIPQTITNKTTTATTYKLSIESTTLLQNVKYYVDTNGDGIRQYTETTELVNGITPSVAGNNGTLKIFVVGKVDSTLPAGQQVTKIFAVSQTNVGDYDFSTITLNLGLAGNIINLAPDVTLTTNQGSEVVIAQTLTNKSATADTYTLSIAEGNPFTSYQFILDTNGDGIRQTTETTVVTTTSSVPGSNGTYKFFLVGTLRGDLQATEVFKIFTRSTTNNASVDWAVITLNITTGANVQVQKSVGTSAVPGTFNYVFTITNPSATAGSALTINDTLPTAVLPDATTASWTTFGGTTAVTLTHADDGVEANASGINHKIVNNQMTFTLNAIPANVASGATGGFLTVRVKMAPGIATGTVIDNNATYTYNNGTTNIGPVTSNTASYTVPASTYNVILSPDVTRTAANGEQLTIAQTLTNDGTSADSYTLAVSNTTLFSGVVFYLDTNGDGIRQITETTVIANGTTPSIAAGGTYKFFAVGRVNQATPGAATFNITATSVASTTESDASIINLTVYNAGQAALLDADTTLTFSPGETITVPQTLTNKSATASTYNLTVEENTALSSFQFILDTNGDGIRQASETTVINNPTSSVAGNNGTLKFFLVGTIGNTVTTNQTFRIYARSTTDSTGTDWSIVTLNINTNIAVINVTKSLGVTSVPGATVYMFDIVNTGSAAATNFTLVDPFPEFVEPDLTFGIWFPAHPSTTGNKNLTVADDGAEVTDTTTNLKFVNGVLTFQVQNIAANSTPRLVIRVRPKSGAIPGTVTTNTATYGYNNGSTTLANISTNSVNWTIPATAIVGVNKTVGTSTVPGAFTFLFKITNTGSVAAGTLSITDTLPTTGVVYGTTSKWTPFGSTTPVTVTHADDGYEANAATVAYRVLNGVLTISMTNVPANQLATSDGGVFELTMTPDPTVGAGNAISNTAYFAYVSGSYTVTTRPTPTATYIVPEGTATLTLQKLQALDANNDNTIDAPYGTTALTGNPGSKIFYKLVVTNTGTGTANNVQISDNVAQYTTMTYGDGTVTDKGKPSWRIGTGAFTEVTVKPAVGGTGLIQATIPSLGAGQTAELFYNVKVDQ
ncbi:hypothetical protein [Cetobacterium sp. SF1]|uniref:hypothetical protein n=1 Tax=Cetobacterium sp. SF1 TaxID=3417654 RepID=UPI003CE6D09B